MIHVKTRYREATTLLFHCYIQLSQLLQYTDHEEKHMFQVDVRHGEYMNAIFYFQHAYDVP